VANDGVITALDGAASQYVRGDGTLADFPTSTGGGSSVSYYLNSSVSQGTIGGVAYRQLSKTPISGAGTDITASTNGYIANYITDANDPSLLEVPAGNFNCEFYFSVNSNNHNAYVYAELYKYDGTTFTLLGSNQAIPEYLTNGTTLSAYYFAIPVAVAALTITDRISIRIYVNVDGRTVTLHTENSHLCQVVTTFSKGLTSLNNLTRQVQFLGTGTSGTDFNISSVTATHTFNLPVASASNTGKLSSTDWSTFNNKQNALTNPITGTGASGNVAYFDGTTSITAENSFNYDASLNRLGVNTTVPNATIGANAGIDSGYSLLLKNSDSNYNGIGFGTDSTYGNLIATEKLGSALSRNLTLLNQSGYISLTEAGNLGVGLLTPNTGIDIYNATTSSLWLHNAASGITGTDGVRLVLFNNLSANLRNFDGAMSITSEGDFSIITIGAENFRVNSTDGSIYQSKVANAMLKSVSGVITAAVAGTDYVAPSALSSYVPTSRTLTINSVTYDLSADRSWTITAGISGSGTSGQIAYFNGSTSITSESGFIYDASTNRLGVNTSVPNATIGGDASLDGGYGLLIKTGASNYNGIGISINSTYGNLISTEKLGSAVARNLTLLNQSGFVSLTESGNFGVGILTPNNGIDIYNSTQSQLWLHNAASGVSGTDGVRLALFNNLSANLRNFEGGLSLTAEGDFSIITIGTENIKVNSANGYVAIGGPATITSMLTVNGAITQSVTSALIKTNASGTLVAAVAGTDYVVGSSISGTTNRIAKFTGTGSIGDSGIFDNGTNVIFGGTSNTSANPTVVMQNKVGTVLSVAGFNWAGTTTDNNSVNSLMIIGGYLNSSTQTVATAASASGMQFYNGGFYWYGNSGLTIGSVYTNTQRMFLTVGGNLIIGSGGDGGYKLDVSGTGRFTGDLTGTSASFSSTLAAGDATFTNVAPLVIIKSNTTGNVFLRFMQTVDVVSTIYYQNSSSSLNIANNIGELRFSTGGVSSALVIANAGAATFSRNDSGNVSVTIANAFLNQGNLINFQQNKAGSTINAYIGHGGDSSGDFIINNGTQAITIKNTGNVGIGTSSPLQKLHVYNSASSSAAIFQGSSNSYIQLGVTNESYIGNVSGALLFEAGGSERMRITSGGNVGIGTSSPSTKLHIIQSLGNDAFAIGETGSNMRFRIGQEAGYTGNYIQSTNIDLKLMSYLAGGSGGNIIFQTGASDIGSLTERMRITSGGTIQALGSLLIGSASSVGYKAEFYGGGSYTMYVNQSGGTASYIPLAINHNVTSGTIRLINFSVGGSTDVGSITTNGTTTTYGVTSDYRLKQDLKDYNALDLISNIKTYDFEWKNNKSRSYGVLAHELAEVLPYSVVYEKDGVKDDGSIIPQNVDYSKIVPILVKAIQEQQSQIEELKELIKNK
jgi:hypothetical protein